MYYFYDDNETIWSVKNKLVIPRNCKHQVAQTFFENQMK